MVMGIFVVALVGPGLLQTARSVPSHGEFIGTLEGGPFAIRQGWTSRFPGLIFHPELADWLEKHGPHHTMAFLPEFDAYRSYIEKQQKWNTLSKTIRVVRPSSADILIVPALKQHPRWTPVTHLFQSVKKQEVISIDGAPLYQIYYLNQPSQ